MGPALQTASVLILPGLHDSCERHWQSEWCRSLGCDKVDFGDWDRPTLHGWIQKLESKVCATRSQVVLVAHSLGCLAVAWWARRSRCTGAVAGALLVAPPDVDRCDCPAPLRDFRPAPNERLPFRSILVASRDDPYAAFAASSRLATRWGSDLVDAGAAGHLNALSGLGRWNGGLALLRTLVASEIVPPPRIKAMTAITDRVTVPA